MSSSQPKQAITTAYTPSDFPGSAEWLPLRDAKDSVPAFDLQNAISYFIERKTKDNEANKDYMNVSNKAFGLFRHQHIQKVELACDSDEAHSFSELESFSSFDLSSRAILSFSFSTNFSLSKTFTVSPLSTSGLTPLFWRVESKTSREDFAALADVLLFVFIVAGVRVAR